MFYYHFDKSYGTGKVADGLIVLDINGNVHHVKKTNKRKGNDMTITYMWYLRFGHINENWIKKLYKDGYLDPYDHE